MLKFAFITTRNTNVGDDFVREGLRAALDEICEYHPYLVHKHDPESTCGTPYPEEEDGPVLSDKLLEADAIFQTGAPVYWNLGTGPGQKCCTAEWIGPFWYDRIARVSATLPVLNIAAGGCQSYYGSAREIVDDPDCALFIRDIHAFCRITTVRDTMAEEVNSLLGLSVIRMPCVSIHAWRRHKFSEVPRAIALNFMPIGGHYDLDGKTDPQLWARNFLSLDRILRLRGLPTSLVAHDRKEFNVMSAMFPDRTVFFSEDYRDYVRYYAGCRGGVFNRVHGAMLLAGRGAPALVLGNDSRARMVDELGLPRWHVSEADPEIVAGTLIEMLSQKHTNARLIQTEDAAFLNLKKLLSNSLAASPLPQYPEHSSAKPRQQS